MKLTEMTVEIKADTTELDKALKTLKEAVEVANEFNKALKKVERLFNSETTWIKSSFNECTEDIAKELIKELKNTKPKYRML